MINLNNI